MATRTWTGGDAGDLASAAANWNTGVPIAGDAAIFPAGSSGLCTWNVTAALLSITVDISAGIIIDQSVKVTCTGAFYQDSVAGGLWSTKGFDIEASDFREGVGATIAWAPTSELILVGVASGNVDSANPIPNVTLRKTAAATINALLANISTQLTLDATLGNQTFVLTGSISINKIVTIGAGAFSTTVQGATETITVVDATGVNEYSDWQNTTISGGPITCNPDNCTDLGGNTGILFAAITVKYNIATGAHDSDDDTQWSMSSGGANNTTAPGFDSDVIFDANSTGACNWNTPEIGSLLLDLSFANVVTQAVDLIINGNHELIEGTYDEDTFNLSVLGAHTNTNAIFTKSAASGLLFVQGDCEITASSSGNAYDGDVSIGEAGVTVNVRSNSNNTRYDMIPVPGTIYRLTGRWYCDKFKVAGGDWGMTDNGGQRQIPAAEFDNFAELSGNIVTTDLNRIRIGLSTINPDVVTPLGDYDAGGAQIELINNGTHTLPLGMSFTTLGDVEALGGNNQTNIFNLLGRLNCRNFSCGHPSNTLRGNVTTITGSLVCSGDCSIYDIVITEENKIDAGDADQFSVGGAMFVADTADATLDLSGTLVRAEFQGDVAISALSTFVKGTAAFFFTGSNNQEISLATNSPYHIQEHKSGGFIDYKTVWALTGAYAVRVMGAYNSIFLAGGAYSATLMDINRGAPISEATQVTVDSSDSITQFTITVTGAAPVARHADFSQMNFLGADQPCATESCSNTLNNNVSPPSPGLVFASNPLSAIPYGYSKYNRGLGLGSGLGLGGAYV